MRNLLWGIAALAAGAFGAASAMADDLEALDPQISQAFAQFLNDEIAKVENLQVKIEGDIDKATGVHREQVGLILVPQKDLNAEEIPDAVNSDPGAAMGHLFMSMGFTPVIDGKPLAKEKLRTVKFVGQDGNEQEVSYLALSARHTDDDVWHLYGYGSDEKPVLDVMIGEGVGPGTQPLALEVRDIEADDKAGEVGTCYVTIYDRFQTNFKLAYKAPEEKSDDK